MKLLTFFGKNSNILLTELALAAINQVALRIMMPSLNGLSFGMKFITFHSLRFLVLLHVELCHLGIGSAKQSWSDVKTIKNGKRENIGGESLEKRSILYSSKTGVLILVN